MGIPDSERSSKINLRDAAWVKSIRETGDRAAYTALMEAYFDKVYNRMLKMTGHTGDAEDLAMEAFVRAFGRLGSYTPNHSFSAWLIAVAKNNAIDFIRHRRSENGLLVSELDNDQSGVSYEVPDHVPGPEQQLIAKQQSHLLRQIVNTLPAKYRHIISMYYFDELSTDEIAAKLEIPVNTVKIRLFRARTLLSGIMQHS